MDAGDVCADAYDHPHTFPGDWNYTIHPSKAPVTRLPFADMFDEMSVNKRVVGEVGAHVQVAVASVRVALDGHLPVVVQGDFARSVCDAAGPQQFLGPLNPGTSNLAVEVGNQVIGARAGGGRLAGRRRG